MRNINISKVHFEMLQAIAKKQRVKPTAALEEMIQKQYEKK
tara:strand:+ start:305 stop:427 length:123 start_codon:yes stop_codon:yes gene_type:complete